MMKRNMRKGLERAGGRGGDAGTFSELSEDERQFVEMKVVLTAGLPGRRERRGLTQVALARRHGSIQSRIAKMEAAGLIDRPVHRCHLVTIRGNSYRPREHTEP